MNAELTAEKRPACAAPGSAFGSGYGNQVAHKDEGCIQVLIVFLCVISVKFSRLLAIHCKKVGPRVIGLERIEEFFESGMETGSCVSMVAWLSQ